MGQTVTEIFRTLRKLLGKLVDEESNEYVLAVDGNFQEYIMRKLLGHKDVEHERDRIDFVVPDTRMAANMCLLWSARTRIPILTSASIDQN